MINDCFLYLRFKNLFIINLRSQMGHYLECADNMSTVLTVKLQ